MRRGVTIGIFLAAAVFWGFLLLQADDSVFSRAPLLDELYYLDRAAEISGGPAEDSGPYFMSPLYPLLVAATGSGDGLSEPGVLPPGSLRGIRLLQIACWFGIAILLRRIAGRTFAATLPPVRAREFVAWFPAILFFLYRPAAVFSLTVLLELPLLLLLTSALDLMTPDVLDPDRPRRWRGQRLGSAIGLAVLLRGTALLVLPIAVWVLWTRTPRGGRRIVDLAGLFLALLIVLAPPVIINSMQAGRLVGPTLNAGLNLYIGNGSQANGFYVNHLPGDWRQDPAGTAYLAATTGRTDVSIPEADVLWMQAAADAIGDQPIRTLQLYAKKIWLHFQGWEIDQLVPLDAWKREAPLLGALILPWRWLVVLGLAGVGLLFGGAGRQTEVQLPAMRLWLAMIVVLVMGQSLFFVVSRYRLVMVPELCLLAGAGSAAWLAKPIGFSRPRITLAVAGLLALVLSHPWGLEPAQKMWAVQAKVNEAHRWALLGAEDTVAYEHAEDLYREALTSPSTIAEWWLALALVQIERGDQAGAERTLTEGDRCFPGNLDIQRTLLGILLEQDRRQEAVARAEILLSDHPRDAETLHNYTILLAREGRRDEAVAVARQLMTSNPADARGYMDLGILLARAGDVDQARQVFEQGLEILPGHPDLEKNLSVLADRPFQPSDR